MTIELRCNVTLNIVPTDDPTYGATISYDPETEVLTLHGNYSGPKEQVAERLASIMSTAMLSLAQHKFDQGGGYA